MKFEIGEIVILTETCAKFDYLLNSECIIVDIAESEVNAYIVEFDGFTKDENGNKLMSLEKYLKRKPKDDETTWDKVEKITGWNPTKVVINEHK